MGTKKKQFAVIGLGRFGTTVATALYKLGYDVLAVDSDEERVHAFSNEATHVVQADSTDEETLKALGIRNFDVVVVAIGQDIQSNMMTTLLLRELGVPLIIVKAANALHGKMLEKIGADRVVYPERDMGLRLAHNLVSSNILDFIELSPDLSIVEINAPSFVTGQTLAESNLRALYEVNVVALKRAGEIKVPPRPDEVIQPEDVLVLVGRNEGLRRLEEQV